MSRARGDVVREEAIVKVGLVGAVCAFSATEIARVVHECATARSSTVDRSEAATACGCYKALA